MVKSRSPACLSKFHVAFHHKLLTSGRTAALDENEAECEATGVRGTSSTWRLRLHWVLPPLPPSTVHYPGLLPQLTELEL